MGFEQLRAKLMQDTNLYLPGMPPQADARFGNPLGIPVGTIFQNRAECAEKGVHSNIYAGICGSARLGAFSIVLSGGYEDDQDEGEYIIYTGAGTACQSETFSRSGVQQQGFEHPHNAALKTSQETGKPVRVIRGSNGDPRFSPGEGYRYDGLYKVEKAYLDKGKGGEEICRFELRRLPDQRPLPVHFSL